MTGYAQLRRKWQIFAIILTFSTWRITVKPVNNKPSVSINKIGLFIHVLSFIIFDQNSLLSCCCIRRIKSHSSGAIIAVILTKSNLLLIYHLLIHPNNNSILYYYNDTTTNATNQSFVVSMRFSWALIYKTWVAALWLVKTMPPVRLIADESRNTGNHRPCDEATSEAVSGPLKTPGIVARVFEMANVMAAWLGATSAWLLKWPAELQAENDIINETSLEKNKEI